MSIQINTSDTATVEISAEEYSELKLAEKKYQAIVDADKGTTWAFNEDQLDLAIKTDISNNPPENKLANAGNIFWHLREFLSSDAMKLHRRELIMTIHDIIEITEEINADGLHDFMQKILRETNPSLLRSFAIATVRMVNNQNDTEDTAEKLAEIFMQYEIARGIQLQKEIDEQRRLEEQETHAAIEERKDLNRKIEAQLV